MRVKNIYISILLFLEHISNLHYLLSHFIFNQTHIFRHLLIFNLKKKTSKTPIGITPKKNKFSKLIISPLTIS